MLIRFWCCSVKNLSHQRWEYNNGWPRSRSRRAYKLILPPRTRNIVSAAMFASLPRSLYTHFSNTARISLPNVTWYVIALRYYAAVQCLNKELWANMHRTRFLRKLNFFLIRYRFLHINDVSMRVDTPMRNHSITVLSRRERGIYKPRELDTLRSERQKCKSSLPIPRDNWARRASTQAFLTKVGLLLNSILN